MRFVGIALAFVVAAVAPSQAQGLHLPSGTNGVEVSAGWSVGPSSNGIETVVGGSIGGRLDLGVQISHYRLSFDDGSETLFENYAPLVRWFAVKEQSGAPVSVALTAQLFVDRYESDEDSGSFVEVGPTVYKAFTLGNRWSITPFAGFALVAESYSFGGAPADRAQYLSRDLGLHFTSPADRPWLVRFTLLEQSYRQETYRAAQVAVIKKL